MTIVIRPFYSARGESWFEVEEYETAQKYGAFGDLDAAKRHAEWILDQESVDSLVKGE
jgi:hypothetical protein